MKISQSDVVFLSCAHGQTQKTFELILNKELQAQMLVIGKDLIKNLANLL